MGRKLYVGNLPYEVSETELQELFGRAGSVESVTVMRDQMTGRARGFAFVEMSSDEEAQTAIRSCTPARSEVAVSRSTRPGRRPRRVAAVSVTAIRSVDGRNRAGSEGGEHTRGAVRRAAPARTHAIGRPQERRGTANSGRIVALFIGRSHGFIRLPNGRDVFFHRSDVNRPASFNAFAIGDHVAFELLEDAVSGPRAVRVEPRQPGR